ncbi:short-chain dehydrogenase/reductase SDR domain protein [Burkholderia mallei]|nr:short-chain dehydrogenase/reductase SDR domain protein [Burkholderia mallei]
MRGPQLDPQRLEILDRRRLRRAVRARARQPAHAGHARDADERAAPRGRHRRDERLERRDHPVVVDVHDLAERGQIAFARDRALADAGVRDHDVGAPVRGDEARRGERERIGVAHVGRVDRDRGLGKAWRELGERIGAPGDEAERRAVPRVFGGEREAEPAGGAGDEDLERGRGVHAGAMGITASCPALA